MKKLVKKKNGFTLVEIILVVAILVILVSAAFISAPAILGKSNSASDKLDSGIESLSGNFVASEQELQNVGFGT